MVGTDWANQFYGDAKHYSPSDLKVVSQEIQQALQSGGAKRGYLAWTKEELLKRAKKLKITGASSLTKAQLIAVLRKKH